MGLSVTPNTLFPAPDTTASFDNSLNHALEWSEEMMLQEGGDGAILRRAGGRAGTTSSPSPSRLSPRAQTLWATRTPEKRERSSGGGGGGKHREKGLHETGKEEEEEEARPVKLCGAC